MTDSSIIGLTPFMGRQSEARERLEELSSIARFRYVPPVYPAILNVALGDHDAAFAWLEKAYEDRSGCMAYSQSYGLAVDPCWDPLRGDPRYTDLLRRIGLLDRLQPLGAGWPARRRLTDARVAPDDLVSVGHLALT